MSQLLSEVGVFLEEGGVTTRRREGFSESFAQVFNKNLTFPNHVKFLLEPLRESL